MTQDLVLEVMSKFKSEGKDWVSLKELLPLVDCNYRNLTVCFGKLWRDNSVLKRRVKRGTRNIVEFKLVEEDEHGGEISSVPKEE